MSFTDSKRCGGYRGLNGGFLGRIRRAGCPTRLLEAKFDTEPIPSTSPFSVCIAKSVRVRFVPFFEINLGVVALFFFRVALPRLIRLFMGALIRLLPRVVFGGLFAHFDTSTFEVD